MKASYQWLQTYIEEKLPSPEEIAEKLTLSAYEVEEMEELPSGDVVFDIDILPNRSSDSLGHIGIAREVAVLFDLTLKLPQGMPDTASFKSSDLLKIELDPKVARRATKRIVKGVKIAESPAWLKERLASVGQRSINNIVDITNFVMWETGNPVHAFDFGKVEGGTIEVRFAKDEETIIGLDGNTYELSERIPVIADAQGPLDIAGVKGGAHSGVDESTRDLMLSVCSFTPSLVRKASRELGLRTDASKRFENDVPPATVEHAMKRLTELILEVAGGEASEDFLDLYPLPRNPYKTGASESEINAVLGTSYSNAEITDVLEKLGFEVEEVIPRETIAQVARTLEGKPYKYGASISVDAPNAFDCSSFVAYVYAQAGISIPRVTIDQFVFGHEILESDLKPGDLVFSQTKGETSEDSFVRVSDGEMVTQKEVHFETQDYMPGTKVKEGVNHVGIYLGDGKVIHASGPSTGAGKIIIEDLEGNSKFGEIRGCRRTIPSEDARFVVTVPYWRTDVLRMEDLAEEVGRVLGYGNIEQEPMSAFENDGGHTPLFLLSEKVKDILVQNGFTEVLTYAFRDSGFVALKNPIASDKAFFRANLRDGMNDALTLNAQNRDLFKNTDVKLFEIGNVATEAREETRLSIGARPQAKKSSPGDALVHDALARISETLGIEIKADVKDGVAEIVLTDLAQSVSNLSFETLSDEAIKYKSFSLYPFVTRDVALWVPSGVSEQDVEAMIRESAGGLLVQLRLFDRFEKEDRISYAFRLTLQSPSKTLTDEEANTVMESVYKALKSRDFEIR